jgi:uncharacterized protein YkwD
MPGRLKTPVALLTCVCTLAVAAPAQAGNAVEHRLVHRINDVRAAHGLRQLQARAALNRGAHAWSRHLVRADAFYHARLASGTGEILAWGTCSWFKPSRAVRMWLRSPGHRALILRPGFRFVGTGWSRGSWSGYSCVEMAVARFR